MLVQYTQENIHGIGKVVLKPGLNDIPNSTIKAFTAGEKKVWDRRKSEGLIVEVKTKSAVTVKMVKETSDLALLKTWEIDTDLKGPVKGAIRKQILAIESIVDEVTDEKEVL